MPLVPHVDAAAVAHWVVGLGACPAMTGLHVPALPATAHDMHVPVQAVAQQTPCWHRLDEHSEPGRAGGSVRLQRAAAVAADGGRRRNRRLVVQVALQVFAVVSQVRLPGQLTGVTGLHIPAPSQVAGGVYMVPVHEPAVQTVPLGQSRQWPAPSHSPSVRQPPAPVAVHWVAGVGALPDGTGEQVPAEPASAHDRQVPVQAVSQQTPCAQNPDTHDAAVVQAAPGGSLPQLPLAQTLGATQSALVVQVALQAAPCRRRTACTWPSSPSRQVPAPSQVRACVNVDPVQEAAPQLVPAG